MSPKSVLSVDDEVLVGTRVFVGTRVPIHSFFDYLKGGETVDEFLRQFPSVSEEQAKSAIEMARDSIISSARST